MNSWYDSALVFIIVLHCVTDWNHGVKAVRPYPVSCHDFDMVSVLFTQAELVSSTVPRRHHQPFPVMTFDPCL